MSWIIPDVLLPGIGPQRLSALHPPLALAAADAAAVVLSGLACRSLNTIGHAGHTLREILVILGMAGLTVVMLRTRGLYGPPLHGVARSRPLSLVLAVAHAFALLLLALLFWEQAAQLCQVAGWRVLGSEANGILATNRNWLFTWAMAAPVLLLLLRGPVEAAFASAEAPPARLRAVVIGDAAGTARLARQLRRGQWLGEGVEIIGCFSRAAHRGQNPAAEAGWPALPNLGAARALIARGEADLLLIALPERAVRTIAAIRRAMAGLAVDIWLAPESEWLSEGRARLSSLAGLPFLHLQERPMAGASALLKRAEDIAIGLAALTVALPLMAVIAAAIRLGSPGPVFFIQPRLGLNGRIIHVRKFRTMRAEVSDPSGRQQARPGDCRVTAIGRLLRRTSLDELPQLLNVLGGSMSLVGPRPHALGTEAGGLPFGEAAAGYAARHRVKPGITGWAQVSGLRGETDTVEKLRARVRHDLDYIARWSLWFDLRILALTLRAVLRGDGV